MQDPTQAATPPTLTVVESVEYDEPTVESGEKPEPEHRTLLEVWREVLRPARDGTMRSIPVTPQWATRIVASYEGIGYADTVEVNQRLLDMVEELGVILDEVIEADDDCLAHTTAEADATENAENYRTLLLRWQGLFLTREVEWNALWPDAAVALAAMSEAHKMFFGEVGLVAHLDSIKFPFTESDQQKMHQELEAVRDEQLAARLEAEGV
jgi:hypothetical protein